MRASPPSPVRAAVTLLAVAAAVLLWAPRVAALETLIPNDQNYQSHHAKNLPAPAGPTEPLRLHDMAVGSCAIWGTGVDVATFRCGVDGTDFLSPTTGLLAAGHAATSVVGRAAGTSGAAADISCPTPGTFLGNVGGTLSCAAAAGVFTPDAPLVFGGTGGSHLQLTLDGTSLGTSAGALRLLAGTGAVTWAAGTTATSFGTQAALSSFGNWSNSSAVPSANVANVPLSVPMLNAGGTAISWAPVTPATSGGVATWSTAGIRIFAVDPAGSDTNLCWADSADQTQPNVAIATQAAGALPCATIAGATAEIPPVGAGRALAIVIKGLGASYSDPAAVFNGIRGYAKIIMRGTGTGATANATAFAGDVNDLTFQGAVTAAGLNTGGYNPTGSATSATVTIQLAGGGAVTFGAEPATPLYRRARFAYNTTTTALQNQVFGIIAVPGANQITLDTSITYVGSDVFYIEEPGVVLSNGLFLADTQPFTLNGLSPLFLSTLNAQTTVSFCDFSLGIFVNGSPSFSTVRTSALAPTSTRIGPVFSSALSVSGGSTNFTASTLGTSGAVTVVDPVSLSFSDNNVVGTNFTLTGGAGGSLSGSSVIIGGTTTATRILGTLTLNGTRVVLRLLNLPSTTAAFGVVAQGQNDIVFGQPVVGGTKTNAGLNLTDASQSRVWFNSSSPPTITGSGGDIYWGRYTIVAGVSGTGDVYSGWVDFIRCGTSTTFPNGTNIIASLPVAGAGDVNSYPVRRAGMIHNRSDFPLVPGEVVIFNDTDGSGGIPILADSVAHVAGGVGIVMSVIPVNGAGFAIQEGPANVAFEPGACGGAITTGARLTYASATTPGTITCLRPAIARTLGWTTSEGVLSLSPANELEPVSRIYNAGTAQNTEPGLNLVFPTGTPLWADNTGSQRTDLTFPSWLVDPGSNGMLARTALGTTVARSLTNTDGTITITNPDGVSANPIINTTGLTPSTRTVTGTAPVSIAGDHSAHDLSANRTWALDANGITDSLFRQSGPLALVGRSANSTGNTGDISAAASSGCVYRESGSTLGCGSITEGIVLNLTTDLAAKALGTRNLIAGLGLTGGGDLTADRTFDVGANADGSITVNANDIQVGVLATDAQHGARGGGTQHAVATASVAGFESAADKAKLDGIAAGATVGTVYTGTSPIVVSGSAISCPTCGTGTGTGTVTTVTGTAPVVITSTPTTTPNVTIQGAILDGTTGTSGQNLGALSTGLLKNTVSAGHATLSAAAGGTDFENPLTFSTGLTRATNTIASNLSTGVSGGQTLVGGTGSGDSVTYSSTSNATKGKHIFGSTGGLYFDESQPSGGVWMGLGNSNTSAGSGDWTLAVNRSRNGGNYLTLTNPSTGSNAESGLVVGNVATGYGSNYIFFALQGTSYGTIGPITANSALYEHVAASSSSPMIFSAYGGQDIEFLTTTSRSERLRLHNNGDVTVGTGLTTSAAAGWLYLPSSAGVPTGTPTSYSSGGVVPMEIDRTNNRLYAYLAPWVPIGQFTGGLATGPLCNTTSTGIWSACTIDSSLSLSGTTLSLPNVGVAGFWINGNGYIQFDAKGREIGGQLGTNYNAVKVNGSSVSTSDQTLNFVDDFTASTSSGTTNVTFAPTLSHYATSEQTYYMEITSVMVSSLNAASPGSLYLATNHSDVLYSAAIEYPQGGTLPLFGKLEACVVGTNTITGGGINVDLTVNGSGGHTLLFQAGDTCQRSATSNFGGAVTDRLGVGLSNATGIGGGSVTVSGTLKLAIKLKTAPVSTF
jgi:hypothetical protein